MLDTDRKWGLACYVPVLNIVACPLAIVRRVNSRFCLFHASQGLVLFALWFLTVLVALFSQVLSLMMWGVVLLLHFSGMYIVFLNKETKIPIVGNIASKIPEHYIFTLLTGKVPDARDVEPDAPSEPSQDASYAENTHEDNTNQKNIL